VARSPRHRALTTLLWLPPLAVLLWVAASMPAGATDSESSPGGPFIAHEVTSIDGEPVDLGRYRGQALLIVNTASKCGYTPQYEGLERLYQRFKHRGLVVVGFPSNDFGNQEPGSNEQIQSFCKRNYGVSFPMMAKIHTTGDDIDPLYHALTQETPEQIRGEIRWNFTKFLVDPEGRVVARFEPGTKPLSEELVNAVKEALPPRSG
jgi:glutathione peroxidase